MAARVSKAGPTEKGNFVFFWSGWPSQWDHSIFIVDGVTYHTAEQWMMAEKAKLFGDDAIYAEILATTDPRKQKSLGRRVKGFVEETWQARCSDIVYEGNMHKFSQHKKLRTLLLATGDKVLAEASPLDAVWGIGLAVSDPLCMFPDRWPGTNLLGKALMRVRATLRAQETAAAAPAGGGAGSLPVAIATPIERKAPAKTGSTSSGGSSSSSSSAAAVTSAPAAAGSVATAKKPASAAAAAPAKKKSKSAAAVVDDE